LAGRPRVGWIDSQRFDAHRGPARHPERPERLVAIRRRLLRDGLAAQLDRREPELVSAELLARVHEPAYIERVRTMAAEGGGMLDPDTWVVAASWEAAQLAAGGVAQAAREVMAGGWQRAFCLVRPPGHHAARDHGAGFCLFNNVAVGVEAALDAGAERVAIFDWDVHHGDGTQAIFWGRDDVLYASCHQFPYYPGTGARDEVGGDAGRGTTLNCPLPAGAGDDELLAAWRQRVRPALADFAPDLVFVSCGFDADARDELAGLSVTTGGFETLSREVVAFADEVCGGRLVSVLEGGYDLEALADDAAVHVEALLEERE
jgi:acetoin utilization deacetylase AcuC-like enzyme